MSHAANHLRAWTLRRQVDARMREAHTLWLTIGFAFGMGGYPPLDLHPRLEHAVSEAERLTLEYRAAL